MPALNSFFFRNFLISLGIPIFDDADSQAMRINFLSHLRLLSYPDYSSDFFSSRTILRLLILLRILYALPCALGLILFMVGPSKA